jgi:hypothetical protein
MLSRSKQESVEDRRTAIGWSWTVDGVATEAFSSLGVSAGSCDTESSSKGDDRFDRVWDEDGVLLVSLSSSFSVLYLSLVSML